MPSPDRPALRLVVGLAASAVIHVIALRTASVAASNAGDQASERIPRPPAAPPEPETTPGIERSDARTLTWIGHEAYEEHMARLAEVEQSAFALAPAAAVSAARAEGDGGTPEPGTASADAARDPGVEALAEAAAATDAAARAPVVEATTPATADAAPAPTPSPSAAEPPTPAEALAEATTEAPARPPRESPAAAASPDALVRGAAAPAPAASGSSEAPAERPVESAAAAPRGPDARPSLADLASRPDRPGDAAAERSSRPPVPATDPGEADRLARSDSDGGTATGLGPDEPSDAAAPDPDRPSPARPTPAAGAADVSSEAVDAASDAATPAAAAEASASDADAATPDAATPADPADAAASDARAAPSATARAIAAFVEQMRAVVRATSPAVPAGRRGGDDGAAERTVPGTDAPAADGTAPPRDGEVAQRESDATRRTPVSRRELQTGTAVAREGVEILPVAPEFLTHERLLRRPRNPVVRVTFGPGGQPTEVAIVETTGHPTFDGSVRDCLFRWRATGSKVDALGPEDRLTFEFTLLFNR